MTHRKFAILLLGLAALLPLSAAQAQSGLPFAPERIRDRSDVQIDPALAYILVEATMFGDIEFFKLANEAELAAWESARVATLAQTTPEQREGLTGEIDGWPAAESQLRLQMGVLEHFERKRSGALYLYAVPPGTYVFYSYNSYGLGDCACMGTVSFPVTAGRITALRLKREYLDTQGQVMAERPRGITMVEALMRSGLVVSGPTEAAYDPRLPRDMIQPAEFSPVPEAPNWGRRIVNRVMPIAGLFHYERDRMVVERAGVDGD